MCYQGLALHGMQNVYIVMSNKSNDIRLECQIMSRAWMIEIINKIRMENMSENLLRVGIELTTLVVLDTDFVVCCKSGYNTITGHGSLL
jgi:hypothetical protein